MSKRTVWHYTIRPAVSWHVVEIPSGAKLLHYEGGRFWVEVEPTAPLVKRAVGLFGTGWDLPTGAQYVSTEVEESGFVWHLYDGGPIDE